MKILKKYFLLFNLINIVIVLVSCKSSIYETQIKDNNSQAIYYNEIGKFGEDLPVTRLDAAISISSVFEDFDNIKNLENKANFKDVDIESEDYIFVNYVFSKGIMIGQGEFFNPNEPLTIIQAQSLMDIINPDSKTKIKMSDDIKDKPISYALWNSLLFEITKDIGCQEIELKLFDVDKDNYIYYTDKGEFKYYTTSPNIFVGNIVKVFAKNNNIIGFTEIIKNEIDLYNVFLKKESENKVSIDLFSRKRIFNYSIENDICADIVIKNNDIEVNEIYKNSDEKIKLISDTYIEIEKTGRLEYDKNFTVYSKNGIIKDKSELLCAKGKSEIYIKDNKVCSIWFDKEEKPKNIRVLLSDNSKDGYIQQDIVLRSKNGFTLYYGENIKEFMPDERLNIDKGNSVNYFNDNCRIYIVPLNNGKISIETLQKAKNFPEYRGIIEIEKRDSGFVIVNELPFEEYLYSVVPCEMPISFGKVPLMVQAITARSYGYNQFFLNRFSDYGANIDDTTSSQVYNNMGEYEESTQAVIETENMFLTYENVVISANYFSTSFGFTANSGETWADTVTKEFPCSTKEYLISKPQFETNNIFDLSNEEEFKNFIETNIDSYDKLSPWYRWNVNMTGQELSQIIKRNSENLFRNSPAMMLYSEDGIEFKNEIAPNIGRIKNIDIIKRGKGGNIMIILIEGENGFIKVNSEYNIRKLLQPKSYIAEKDIILKCSNGIEFKNLSILPSSFFTFDYTKDEEGFIENIIFKGGGNGHGVGMSQNGVKGMAEKGYSFDQILKHYFEGTNISVIK